MRSDGSVIFDVSIPIDGGAQEKFQVRVSSSPDGVKVRDNGGRLPESGCPERHINFDASLCLGIAPKGTKVISNDTEAHDWWISLEYHLQLQVIAEVLKRWKNPRQLSHGIAADWQIKAEKIAENLGILSKYKEGAEKKSGPFGLHLPKIVKGESRLVNLRARCPCERAMGREKHHIRRRCPDKQLVANLVIAERERRKENDLFWERARKQGKKCCGTLRNCPLRFV